MEYENSEGEPVSNDSEQVWRVENARARGYSLSQGPGDHPDALHRKDLRAQNISTRDIVARVRNSGRGVGSVEKAKSPALEQSEFIGPKCHDRSIGLSPSSRGQYGVKAREKPRGGWLEETRQQERERWTSIGGQQVEGWGNAIWIEHTSLSLVTTSPDVPRRIDSPCPSLSDRSIPRIGSAQDAEGIHECRLKHPPSSKRNKKCIGGADGVQVGAPKESGRERSS
ncbi:hypothetical protein DFP72DRAFT_857920 [Ephemerocybe angulata]|uniref:Uncharacterized protein n=1 Tax=Ephemerocybe angulata TaxID=980116 RepID=A0A8H6LWS9_9AGAR|nr:hypothetical protein DFP72DRAFT_857920 [Tulosesus angulatus]